MRGHASRIDALTDAAAASGIDAGQQTSQELGYAQVCSHAALVVGPLAVVEALEEPLRVRRAWIQPLVDVAWLDPDRDPTEAFEYVFPLSLLKV